MTRKTRASSSYVGWGFRDADDSVPPFVLELLEESVARSGGAGRRFTMLQLAG